MAKRKKIMKICHLDEFRKREYPSTNGEAANWHKVPGGAGLLPLQTAQQSSQALVHKRLSLLGLQILLLSDTNHKTSGISCSVPGLGG